MRYLVFLLYHLFFSITILNLSKPKTSVVCKLHIMNLKNNNIIIKTSKMSVDIYIGKEIYFEICIKKVNRIIDEC